MQIWNDSVTKLELLRAHHNIGNRIARRQKPLDEGGLAPALRNSIHAAEETKGGRTDLGQWQRNLDLSAMSRHAEYIKW